MSTIAAISTAPGNAGIGIIRLSGDDCFKILQKIFKPKNKGEIKGYTIKYGNIVKRENDEIIDEVLVGVRLVGSEMCIRDSQRVILKKICVK